MAKISIEETLASSDVVTALTNSPYLIYSEVLEGARRPLVFLQVVKEIKDLIGEQGNRYQFMKATHLAASKSTEAQMLSGMSGAGQKTLTAVDVSVTDIIWCATQLSDFLKEDFPKIDFVQMNMSNMGKAVMEYLDAYVASTLSAATGTETFDAGASLDYDDIVDSLTEAKDQDWIPDGANPPFLLISSGAAGSILKDATFVSTERYTTDKLARMVAGEVGLIGGCRVLESSLLAGTGNAYIVFPSDGTNGPVVALVWKRELRVTNIYVPQSGYTYFNTSVRAIPVIVQAKGIVKISITGSP
jgi:hypothetical protein